MTKYLADQNQLAFLYEPDTYGVGSNPGTPQWIGLVQDHTPDETTNVISIRYQGSTDRNVDVFADGALDYTGTFTYYPQDWKFLGFAIGSIDETATAGSHVITETNSNDLLYAGSTMSLPSFTLVDSKNIGVAGSNFERVFKGCKVDSYGITWTQGEPVSCEVGYIAQIGSLSTASITPVTPTTTRPYMWSDTKFYISGTLYTGSISNFTDASLTITNNLEPKHYVNGSRMIAELLPQNRDYEFTATMTMDSTTAKHLYDGYIAGSEFVTNISTIGTPGSVFITLSGCKITDMEVPSPVEGTIDQTITMVPQHASAVVFDDITDYNAK
ncbi:MAG: phage tail tube protein [Candidatus Heimdallarchaeaceae archaeon]